jgi:three-Cys-motif partner protein
MAAPKTTVWDLEPHTRAKHEILRRYLQAWMPILSQGGFPQVLYIDGFAGPGCYSRGELGSPVIALRAAIDQRAALKATFLFLFVEIERDRAQVLEEIVAELALPEKFRVTIAAEQTFEAAFQELAQFYKGQRRGFPPTFAFIDPFGWRGVPFSVVRELMSHQSCEVLLTFMYEEINRFIGHPDQEKNFDSFFGTSRWREGIRLADPRMRNRFLHDLYIEQLHTAANVTHVRSFEMRNDRDVTDYFLFYGTNNVLGLKKMKESMWRVDETGEFSFSDATNQNQFVLFEKKPRFDLLERQILDHFGAHETTVGDIEDFVVAHTAFRETHYKTQVLKPLELADPSRLEPIDPPHDRRRVPTLVEAFASESSDDVPFREKMAEGHPSAIVRTDSLVGGEAVDQPITPRALQRFLAAAAA